MVDFPYKVRGKIDDRSGVGVFGYNTASSGTTKGVEGAVKSDDGYGLYTDDDACVGGALRASDIDVGGSDFATIGDRRPLDVLVESQSNFASTTSTSYTETEGLVGTDYDKLPKVGTLKVYFIATVSNDTETAKTSVRLRDETNAISFPNTEITSTAGATEQLVSSPLVAHNPGGVVKWGFEIKVSDEASFGAINLVTIKVVGELT